MSNKIYDLLEIAEEKDTNQNTNQNIAKHVLIRVGLALLVILSLSLYDLFSDLGSNDSLELLIFGAGFLLAWMLFLLVEALVLHTNKKPLLRNANFVLILLPPIFVFGFFSTLH